MRLNADGSDIYVIYAGGKMAPGAYVLRMDSDHARVVFLSKLVGK